RAAMQPDMCQAVLSARVHTTTDLDLQFPVVDEVLILLTNKVFKYPRHFRTIGNSQVAGVGAGTGCYVRHAIKARGGEFQFVQHLINVLERLLTYKFK